MSLRALLNLYIEKYGIAHMHKFADLISDSPKLTPEIIAEIPLKYTWKLIAYNGRITMELLLDGFLRHCDDLDRFWKYYGANPGVTADFIAANCDKQFKQSCIERNPNIYKELTHETWEYRSEHVPIEEIVKNPCINGRDKPYGPWFVRSNPHVTMEFIEANPTQHWRWNNNINLSIAQLAEIQIKFNPYATMECTVAHLTAIYNGELGWLFNARTSKEFSVANDQIYIKPMEEVVAAADINDILHTRFDIEYIAANIDKIKFQYAI